MDNKNHLWLAVIAGGQGTRLFPLSNGNCPKQFCQLDNDNTFVQATVKRYYPLGIKPNHVVVITTTDHQTKLAAEQLTQLGVITPNICQISPRYGYAIAKLKAIEIIRKLDEKAVVIDTPADQYVNPELGFDNFIDTVKKAILGAAKGLQIVVGVKIRDLNTFVGCGHALIDTNDSRPFKRVLGFVEKPDKETALKMLREDNSVCNTGINVWSVESMLAATAALDLEHDKLSTDGLMAMLPELHVVVGEFDWHDCGTLKSLWDISAKTPNHHNASLGKGFVDRKNCLNSLFVAPEGVEIYATGIKDGSVVVSEINGLMYIACVHHDYCQEVRHLVDYYQRNIEILENDYSIKARNCIVTPTNFSDQIRASFIGYDGIQVDAIKTRSGIIQFNVSQLEPTKRAKTLISA